MLANMVFWGDRTFASCNLTSDPIEVLHPVRPIVHVVAGGLEDKVDH